MALGKSGVTGTPALSTVAKTAHKLVRECAMVRVARVILIVPNHKTAMNAHVQNGPNGASSRLVLLPAEVVKSKRKELVKVMIIILMAVQRALMKSQKLKSSKNLVVNRKMGIMAILFRLRNQFSCFPSDPINSLVKLTNGEIGEIGEHVRQNVTLVHKHGQEYVMANVMVKFRMKVNHATKTVHVLDGPNGLSFRIVQPLVVLGSKPENERVKILIIM